MNIKKLAVAASLMLYSLSGWAIPFQGSYTVNVNSEDPGLVLEVSPELGDLSFDLVPGQSTSWISLFDIWTRESSVNDDDAHPVSASVTFSFALPVPFGGAVNGTSQGVSLFWGLWQYGALTWQNGGTSSLSFGDGGILDVHLEDVTFGDGLLGLNESAGTVKGKFSYRRGSIAVPEPTTLTLIGAGLLVVVLVRLARRRGTPSRD